MPETWVQGTAFSVTVSGPNVTVCLALHSPACPSTVLLPRVKVNGVQFCTPRPARLQTLTRPVGGGGELFLLESVMMA